MEGSIITQTRTCFRICVQQHFGYICHFVHCFNTLLQNMVYAQKTMAQYDCKNWCRVLCLQTHFGVETMRRAAQTYGLRSARRPVCGSLPLHSPKRLMSSSSAGAPTGVWHCLPCNGISNPQLNLPTSKACFMPLPEFLASKRLRASSDGSRPGTRHIDEPWSWIDRTMQHAVPTTTPTEETRMDRATKATKPPLTQNAIYRPYSQTPWLSSRILRSFVQTCGSLAACAPCTGRGEQLLEAGAAGQGLRRFRLVDRSFGSQRRPEGSGLRTDLLTSDHRTFSLTCCLKGIDGHCYMKSLRQTRQNRLKSFTNIECLDTCQYLLLVCAFRVSPNTPFFLFLPALSKRSQAEVSYRRALSKIWALYRQRSVVEAVDLGVRLVPWNGVRPGTGPRKSV